MPGVINLYRNQVVPVVTAATGIGTAFSQTFVKNYEVSGAEGLLQLGLTGVNGVFSGLLINVEWSPTNGSGTYFEAIGTWNPLTTGVGLFPISEAGYYRLNITTFTGGTSFTVLATIGLPSGLSTAAAPSNVTLVGSTITLPVSIASPVPVTGTFWQTTQPVSFPGGISISNLSFTNYGSPAVEAANVYVVNPASSTISGVIQVSATSSANASGNPLFVDVTNTVPVTLASTTITGSVAVTGTFYQATQPVSGTVAVSNFPASQAVTGTFWQATQPVSGTFWQTTQPVSGTVAVSNFPSSQPVTGTFWQATQPVSLASTTVTGSVAVTNAGTFAVQDTVLDAALIAQETTTSGVKGLTVFGAVTTSAPTYTTAKSDALSLDTAGNLRVVLNAETTKVIGTVNQGTSPWVISGAVTLASTTVTGSVAVTGTFFQATQPVSIASGQVSSGAIASGAVASGAIASGAIASGAIAAGAVAAGAFVSGSILSGALASGAVVDLTNVTSALAATAPTKAISTSLLAATALPTAVSGGQAIQPMVDKFGRQVCLTAGMRDILGASATTITASTSATSIVAAVASTYCDITSLTLTNSSATATLLTLSDGSTSYVFSAGAGPGWGITIPFNPPLPAASVNTAWTLTCGTSVSSVYAVAQYIKNR
jgi:hypothetical protein